MDNPDDTQKANQWSEAENILLTGAAGFIGWETGKKLLEQGKRVVGIDNLNDYYDVRLKEYRLDNLKKHEKFTFHPADIEDLQAVNRIFEEHGIGAVINLAARAGVRYSMENPFVYMSTNAQGTLNLLELMRKHEVKKMVLASTSSLYAGQPMPFSEELPVNTPISPYAASKKAAEVMAYSYHYLFGIDVSVVRYFTVYGPAGRPDMSIFRFIRWIDEGSELVLYGDGSQSRDFTYVSDIAEGTIKALKPVGFEVINLGNSHPHPLSEVISLMEQYLGRKANIKYHDFQKTDMLATWADVGKAKRLLDWEPAVSLEQGLEKTVEWYGDNRGWVKGIKIDMTK
ncbi:MAG: UDP-glucose 4-epimerase [Syntrophorhabdaceae bacterium PtaU1.Bin034]|nr:MAG: UDP-glucose 4-epimerase [Syntrophorhabdaceae bacterium PtaU1.Bin034]